MRDVGATFALRIVMMALQMVTGAATARILGVEGKGMLAIAMLLPNFLALGLNFGIGTANTYFVGSKRLDISTVAGNSTALALVLSGLGCILVATALVAGLLEKGLPGVPSWALLIALAAMPAILLKMYLSGVLQGLSRIIEINLIEVLRSTVVLASMIVLIVWLDLDLVGALFAYVIGAITTVAVMGRMVHLAGASLFPRFDLGALKQLLPFGLRGYVGNLLSFFNYRLDMFLVNAFLGSAGVGIYSIAVALAEMLWYLPNAVGFVIFPKAAATATSRMNSFTPRVFWSTLAITFAGAIVMALVGRNAIRWVYSEAFADAYRPLLLLLPGVVLLGGGKVLTNEIAGRGYPQYNSINAGLALVLTLAFDLWLIPRYGVAGAALASSIAYSVVFATAVVFYLKVRMQGRLDERPQVVAMGHVQVEHYAHDHASPAAKR